VSVYELTLEPGTPFARAAERGRIARADEETAARMLEVAEERLSAAGYRRYEISSYARPAARRATTFARGCGNAGRCFEPLRQLRDRAEDPRGHSRRAPSRRAA